jgi:hypothetical protein
MGCQKNRQSIPESLREGRRTNLIVNKASNGFSQPFVMTVMMSDDWDPGITIDKIVTCASGWPCDEQAGGIVSWITHFNNAIRIVRVNVTFWISEARKYYSNFRYRFFWRFQHKHGMSYKSYILFSSSCIMPRKCNGGKRIMNTTVGSATRTQVLQSTMFLDMMEEPYTGAAEIGENLFSFWNGRLHTFTDQPSAEYADGHCEHHKRGVLHRDPDEGPAVYSLYGEIEPEYWMNGKRISAPAMMGVA